MTDSLCRKRKLVDSFIPCSIVCLLKPRKTKTIHGLSIKTGMSQLGGSVFYTKNALNGRYSSTHFAHNFKNLTTQYGKRGEYSSSFLYVNFHTKFSYIYSPK